MKIKWKLEDAVDFCQKLQKYIIGFGVGITGSVLHTGESAKDLDIIIYPNSTALRLDIQGLKLQLIEFGMKRVCTREQVASAWKKKGSSDTKHVEIWSYQSKRIDIFFLT